MKKLIVSLLVVAATLAGASAQTLDAFLRFIEGELASSMIDAR